MNYLKIYITMMRKAEKRENIQGYEKHHVFPTSIFGKNSRVVKLTTREHFIAHKLLYKILLHRKGNQHTHTKKMLHALRCMMVFRDEPLIVSSKLYSIIREHNRERRRGDNNPSKRVEVRKKISESKKGVSREDIKGKEFFGSTQDKMLIIEKSKISKQKTMERNLETYGKKIQYPSSRNSPPCADETREKIRESRLKTNEKYIKMSESEFQLWLQAQELYSPSGRRNGNITRALIARGVDINEFYRRAD